MKPKIGKFRVPKIRLKILLDELNELYKKHGNNEFTITEFGNTLNISESSSGLQQKKYELKNLGLLKGEDAVLKITDSGVKVLQPDISERQKEIEALVKRVSLWDELLKIGRMVDDNQLFMVLKNKTDLSEEELKERFKEIKWAFNEDVKSINQFDPTSNKTTKSKPKHAQKRIIQNVSSQIIVEPQTKLIKEKLLSNSIVWKVSSEFGEFQTEITDALSLSNARNITIQLLDTIERKIMDNKTKTTSGFN
jgi:hypothetical protein